MHSYAMGDLDEILVTDRNKVIPQYTENLRNILKDEIL